MAEHQSSSSPLDKAPDGALSSEAEKNLVTLFNLALARVPAYAKAYADREPDQENAKGPPITLADLTMRAPLLTKESYVAKFPLPLRCIDGDVSRLHHVHTSTGSTGTPTMWARTLADELTIARRFKQVLCDGFQAHKKSSTLAIICFPMGGWVGGVFTTMCMRHLAHDGLRITTVTPGNNVPEILKFAADLSPLFEQTVLLGYPPFVKGVIEAGCAAGVPWGSFNVKLILAGEVFSERWRSLVAERAGIACPQMSVVSIYGTADAGVLANETPLSAVIRRFLEANPQHACALFGKERLPSLMQYDPAIRFIEYLEGEGTLAISCFCVPNLEDTGAPLLRYSIGDAGGVLGFDQMLHKLRDWGFDALAEIGKLGVDVDVASYQLPFVWVFGRKHWTVSLYGANVYVENIMLGVEHEAVCSFLTGKFVLEVEHDENHDVRLAITAELTPAATKEAAAQGADALQEKSETVAINIRQTLLQVNSEYAGYVPEDKQLPKITLLSYGDPSKFPVGTKHSYINTK